MELSGKNIYENMEQKKSIMTSENDHNLTFMYSFVTH